MATTYGTPGGVGYVNPFAPQPLPPNAIPTPIPTAPPVAPAPLPPTPVAAAGTPIPGGEMKSGGNLYTTPAPNLAAPTSAAPTTTTTTSATTPEGDAIAKAKADDAAKMAELDAVGKKASDAITNIQNGTTPLSQGEMAQLEGLKQQFQVLVDQQKLVNTGAEGIANRAGFAGGAGENSMFQANIVGSVVSAGAAKIADLQAREAAAVAQLTQSFKNDDIKAVQAAWTIYEDTAKQTHEYLQKIIADTQKAIKDANDEKIAAEKKQYDEVTKPINDLAADAAKNGAPASVLDAIRKSGDVGAAIDASGGYLQTATGDLGDYLGYKRQAEATGKTAASYDDWLAAKKASDKAQKSADAYASAYGAALGKAAGEKAVGVTSTKPLTETQAKDFTYAQRGDQANDIIGNLQGAIIGMDSNMYAAQKLADQFDVTSKYVSNDMRQIRQAEKNFVTALLRRESGASISSSEFNTAEGQYFPRPGDDPMTLAQKAQARETAINSFKANVPDYDARVSTSPTSLLDQAETIAENTLKSYSESHPEKQAEMKKDTVTMEKTLGRPISATEFLDAFPEYK